MAGLVYSIKDWNDGRENIDWDRGQRYHDNTEGRIQLHLVLRGGKHCRLFHPVLRGEGTSSGPIKGARMPHYQQLSATDCSAQRSQRPKAP